MLFNKEFYYNYIKKLETYSIIKFSFIFFLISLTFIVIAFYFNFNIVFFAFIGILLSLFVSFYFYTKDKLKIEECKMKFDIYNTIIDISKKQNNDG